VEVALFDALSLLDVHKDMFVAMEIMAAITNMSACPRSQVVLVHEQEAIPTLVAIGNSVYQVYRVVVVIVVIVVIVVVLSGRRRRRRSGGGGGGGGSTAKANKPSEEKDFP